MKTKLLLLLTISTIFYSCSNSDDSDNSIDPNNLIGKWAIISEKETANGTTIYEEDWFHSCSETQDYIEFFTNGEFDWIEHQSDCLISTSGSNTEATWTLTGNTINIGNDPELDSFKIENITSTTLTLKEEFSEGGINYVYFITFLKQ